MVGEVARGLRLFGGAPTEVRRAAVEVRFPTNPPPQTLLASRARPPLPPHDVKAHRNGALSSTQNTDSVPPIVAIMFMNIFRITGDLCHLLSFVVMFWKLHTSRSVAG